MASYPTQLRVGYVGSSRQWVWWRIVIPLMLMMILLVVRCSGNVRPKKPEDCLVYHIESEMGFPALHFEEEFTVGFLPQNSIDALAGVSLQMATDQGTTTIQFSTTNAKQFKCVYNNAKKEKEDGKHLQLKTSDRYFQWVHIPMSLSEGLININQTKNVCPEAILPGNNKTFRITRTDHPTNVVFNCQEGCPIFSNSRVISEYKSKGNTLSGKEIHFRKTKDAETKNSSASLELKICILEFGSNCQSLQKITLPNKIITETWQKLAFTVHHLLKESSARYAELKVADRIIWNDFIVSSTFKTTRLRLRSSEGMDWAIGCDPRKNEPKDAAPPTDSVPQPEPPKHTAYIILLICICILLVPVLILSVALFCISGKIQAYASPASVPSQGPSSLRNITDESGSGGGPPSTH